MTLQAWKIWTVETVSSFCYTYLICIYFKQIFINWHHLANENMMMKCNCRQKITKMWINAINILMHWNVNTKTITFSVKFYMKRFLIQHQRCRKFLSLCFIVTRSINIYTASTLIFRDNHFVSFGSVYLSRLLKNLSANVNHIIC